MIDEACSDFEKTQFAKLAEESNFDAKNRFRLDKKLFAYADKSRMPIDQSKVKDILRNQNVVRTKFRDEIPTYQKF